MENTTRGKGDDLLPSRVSPPPLPGASSVAVLPLPVHQGAETTPLFAEGPDSAADEHEVQVWCTAFVGLLRRRSKLHSCHCRQASSRFLTTVQGNRCRSVVVTGNSRLDLQLSPSCFAAVVHHHGRRRALRCHRPSSGAVVVQVLLSSAIFCHYFRASHCRRSWWKPRRRRTPSVSGKEHDGVGGGQPLLCHWKQPPLSPKSVMVNQL